MSEFSQFLSPPEDIIEDARNGKMIVLVDAEDRENEATSLFRRKWRRRKRLISWRNSAVA